MKNNSKNPRREFIGKLAGTTLGLPAILGAFSAGASPFSISPEVAQDADAWFKNVKGKHRIVYDASEPHGGMPIIWAWAFYHTNNLTQTQDSDMTAMVVLRHNAIPFAMEDKLWAKYKFGEMFKVDDNQTKKPSLRNPVYMPKEGDFPASFIQGIKDLQSRGAMFCVCDLALTVYSGRVAASMNLKAEDVKKEWVAGLHPGIQVVPSGVWAIGRAQENGCGYCYAGG